VLLTSVIFALGGFLNAVFAKNFDQVSFVPTFILTPLTYLGGVFTRSRCCHPGRRPSRARTDPVRSQCVPARVPGGHLDVGWGSRSSIMVIAVVALFTTCVWLMNRGTGIRD
jgi:ABC-2 type transport system permease protein